MSLNNTDTPSRSGHQLPIAPQPGLGRHEPLTHLCWGFGRLDLCQSCTDFFLHVHKGWGKRPSTRADGAAFVSPGTQPNRITTLFCFCFTRCSVPRHTLVILILGKRSRTKGITASASGQIPLSSQGKRRSPDPSPSYSQQVKQEGGEPWCAHLEPAPSEGASRLMGIEGTKGGRLVERSPDVTCSRETLGKT